MKKSDLHREWARVLDMCEGTNVKPLKCWKFEGYLQDELPDFEYDKPESFEFAVAILEDKPVFVGDNIWLRCAESWHIVMDGKLINDGLCSWNPPKKTFMLNGEELPCPSTKQGGEVMIIKVGNQECHFMFESGKDADKVMTSIYNLLIGCTK